MWAAKVGCTTLTLCGGMPRYPTPLQSLATLPTPPTTTTVAIGSAQASKGMQLMTTQAAAYLTDANFALGKAVLFASVSSK